MFNSSIKATQHFIVGCLLFAGFSYGNAQSAGDYRSIATGNWSNRFIWQTYNGATWVTPAAYPSSIAGAILLQSPYTVTINSGVAIPLQMGSLTVQAGATLTDDNVVPNAYVVKVNGLTLSNGTINLTTRSTFAAGGNTTNNGSFSSGKVTVNAGTFTNNTTANIINPGAGGLSGAGQWLQAVNSSLTYQGSSITVTTFTASASGNTVIYNYSSGASMQIASATYYNLTAAGSTRSYLTANTTVLGSLLIAGATRLCLTDLSTFWYNLSIAGDYTSTSSNTTPLFSPGCNVTFNGTSQQTINVNTGTTVATFDNLIIANTSPSIPQIVLSPGTVLGANTSLTMTSGVINLNGAVCSLGTPPATSVTLNYTSGWFYGGTVKRYFTPGLITPLTNAGLLPVGTATNSRPIYLGFTIPNPIMVAGVQCYCNVSALSGTTTIPVNIADTGGPIILQHQGGWNLGCAMGNGNIPDLFAGGTGFGTIGNVVDLRLSYSALTSGSAGTNAGINAFPLVERKNLAPLGAPFYIGSVNAVRSPLPVVLESFSGKTTGDSEVELLWNTKSEMNSYGFSVYRISNEQEKLLIGKVDGHGTTNVESAYRLVDSSPLPGPNYYELWQTDNDGKSTPLKMVEVNLETIDKVSLYPNPVKSEESLHYRVTGLTPNKESEIIVQDLQGGVVTRLTVRSDESGIISGTLGSLNVNVGLYIVDVGGAKKKIAVQ
jgi:hypothetical protein